MRQRYQPWLLVLVWQSALLAIVGFRVIRWHGGGIGHPVLLDANQNLFVNEWPVFVVCELAGPSHATDDASDLDEDIDVVSDDDSALWPQYAVHFKQDICGIAPGNTGKKPEIRRRYILLAASSINPFPDAEKGVVECQDREGSS